MHRFRLRGNAGFPLLLCGLLALAACGGGLSSRGGTAAGFGNGRIEAIDNVSADGGVVTVNGIAYAVSRLTRITFREDAVLPPRASRSVAELRIGMIVTVAGPIDNTFRTGVADNIVFGAEAKGPMTSVTGNRFTVLGKTVTVDNSTVFDNFDNTTGIGSLGVDNTVQVSGPFADVDALTIRATRVAKTAFAFSPGGTVELKGVVSTTPSTVILLRSSPFPFDTVDITRTGFASGAPVAGDYVAVGGTMDTGLTPAVAAGVLEVLSATGGAAAGDTVAVEGIVLSGSTSRFLLGGPNGTLSVDASGAAPVNGTLSNIAPTALLVAEGTMDTAGALLVARRIVFR